VKLLVTGASGFIGKNLITHLALSHEVMTYLKEDEDLEEKLLNCDALFHLAGVNRPSSDEAFTIHNAGLTKTITEILVRHQHHVPIIFSSSTKVTENSLYGKSKKSAEDALEEYHLKTNAPVFIFRLPGVFGKWSRPYYNSVVATFIDQVIHNQELSIHDATTNIDLVYIDDVIHMMIQAMNETGFKIPLIHPVYTLSVGDLADIIKSFRIDESQIMIPNLKDPLTKKLYSTFISYKTDFKKDSYLTPISDDRGSFTELLKSISFGQVSLNQTAPGITKGNHYHHHKHEKFLVIKGQAIIYLRQRFETKIHEVHVSEKRLEMVDIPPGYVHAIKNVGDHELITLMWANEPFDQENPDTYFVEV